MDSINALIEGFATAMQPEYLIFAFLGVLIGTAVGVLPGIGPAMTVALLLPLTMSLEPTAAIVMFAGIYYGGMYGGSTTSILLNTPGESASVITAIEGNKMAKLGRGAAALATAAIGSFVAGTIATVLLTLFAPIIARFGVTLTPADFVALIVVAFITVGALLGASASRGLASLGLGLFIGLIGTEATSGQARYTGGHTRAVRRGQRRAGRRRTLRGRRGVLRRRTPAPWPSGDHSRRAGLAQLDETGRLAAIMAAVAARDSDRIPHRDDTRRRGRRRHLLVVRG